MRKAISYWLIRVAISGSPDVGQLPLVERLDGVEHAAAIGGGVPSGFERYSTGSPLERN